jgi:hypothetical protein
LAKASAPTRAICRSTTEVNSSTTTRGGASADDAGQVGAELLARSTARVGAQPRGHVAEPDLRERPGHTASKSPPGAMASTMGASWASPPGRLVEPPRRRGPADARLAGARRADDEADAPAVVIDGQVGVEVEARGLLVGGVEQALDASGPVGLRRRHLVTDGDLHVVTTRRLV